MDTLPHVAERDAAAMRYLRYIALRDGGYRYCGALGWALREDVEEALGQKLPERLPRLHAQGYLTREDVRARGQTRPVWIYRITQLGADAVGVRDRLPDRQIPSLEPSPANLRDTAFYIPDRSWHVLLELRRAMERRAVSPHLPGEPGWISASDLRMQLGGAGTSRWEVRSTETLQLEEENDGLHGEPWSDEWEPPASGGWSGQDRVEKYRDDFHGWDPLDGETPRSLVQPGLLSADVEWLVRAELVQKWVVGGSRRRGVVLYRITNLGGVAIRLSWQNPR